MKQQLIQVEKKPTKQTIRSVLQSNGLEDLDKTVLISVDNKVVHDFDTVVNDGQELRVLPVHAGG